MSKLTRVPTNLYVGTSDPTTPTPRAGDVYWNSTSRQIRIYSGSAWEDLVDVPTGNVDMTLATTAALGYYMLDGTPGNRTTHADLFALIGTKWGVGDGSTTFGLPDFRGRIPSGVSGTELLGVLLGSRTINLAQIPVHAHTIDHGHAATNSGNDAPDHAHNFNATNISWAGTGTGSVTRLANQGAGAATSGATARHTHPTSTPSMAGSSGNAGSGTDYIPPIVVINFMVKL